VENRCIFENEAADGAAMECVRPVVLENLLKREALSSVGRPIEKGALSSLIRSRARSATRRPMIAPTSSDFVSTKNSTNACGEANQTRVGLDFQSEKP
jgi:hypothetical protein